jgi:2'-5' RNA ligase
MRFGLLQRGFELGRVIQCIESHAELQETKLEVPINGLGWFGRNNRRLAVELEPSEALDELATQSEAVDELLNGAPLKSKQIRVYSPDHLSVFRHLQASKQLLTWQDRRNVERIVDTHLEAAHIGSIALAGIVVGETYNRPHPSLAAG